MFRRPLIPVLSAFVVGIVAGHAGLGRMSQIVVPLFGAVALLLGLSLFVPGRSRSILFLVVFFLTGMLLDQCRYRDSDLIPLARQRTRVLLEGTVLSPARSDRETQRLEVDVDTLLTRGAPRTVREKIAVTVYNPAGGFSPGDRIRFPCRLRCFRNFNNPGGYDHESAMYRKGFSCAGSVSDGRRIVPMGGGRLGFPLNLLEKARRPVRDLIQGVMPDRIGALYLALLLGERQDTDPDLRESFNRTGLGHILAVSGLHIGLVAWISFYLFRWILSRSYNLALGIDIRRATAVVTCIPVIAYACLAGFQVSSQRAMIMVLAYLFSVIAGRERDVWSTLALAALTVLALDPWALYSVSFQLSFCAVIGILWLSPGIYRKLPLLRDREEGRGGIPYRLYTYFAGLFAVTLSAVVFLLPLTSLYFHRTSLVAIPANLTAIPFLGLWIIPFGFLSALSLPLSSSAAELFLRIGGLGLEAMVSVVEFWARFSWADLWTVSPNLLETGLFYGLLLSVVYLKRRRLAGVGLLIVAAALAADGVYWIHRTRWNPGLKVTFLDVGQGNAALVQFPGKERMLIDGGGLSRDTFDVGKMVVAPFLFHSKIRRIDYLVLSHPHADHMNGLRFIASHFGPREFWFNGEMVESGSFRALMEVLNSEGIKTIPGRDLTGGRVVSGVLVEVLPAPVESGAGRRVRGGVSLNNHSMVLKLTHRGKSCLFPGDLEGDGEKRAVLGWGERLQGDVLLVPHHGGKSSCTIPFLDRVRPKICVISSGGGNPFGFPHSQTLERLRKRGSRILRTDLDGAITVMLGPRGSPEVTSFVDRTPEPCRSE